MRRSTVFACLFCCPSLLAPNPAIASSPPDRVVLDAAACPELALDRAELRRLVGMELAADGVREVLEPGVGVAGALLRVTVLARPCAEGSSRFELSVEGNGDVLVRQTALGDPTPGRERVLALAIAELVRAFWEQPVAPIGPAPVDAAPEPPAHPPRQRVALAVEAGARWLLSLQPLFGGGIGVEVPLGPLEPIVVGLGLSGWTGSTQSSLGTVRVLHAAGRLDVALTVPIAPTSLVIGAALEIGAAHLFAEPEAPGARGTDATGWTTQALGFVGLRHHVSERTALLLRAELGGALQSFTGNAAGEPVAGLDGLVLGLRLGVGYAP